MTRRSIAISALMLFAAAALPVRGSAQESDKASRGPLLGLGAGMSGVNDARTDAQRTGATYHLRAGWEFGAIAPMVEVAGHRMGDVMLPDGVANSSPVMKTGSLLASVQVELPRSFYVRPGVGIGYHVFQLPDSVAGFGLSNTDIESGPAAGLALGRTMDVLRVISVAIEGVALWSQGGEATGTRWAAGIQVVALLR